MTAAVAVILIAIATTTTNMAKAAAATNSETEEAAHAAASFLAGRVRGGNLRRSAARRHCGMLLQRADVARLLLCSLCIPHLAWS